MRMYGITSQEYPILGAEVIPDSLANLKVSGWVNGPSH